MCMRVDLEMRELYKSQLHDLATHGSPAHEELFKATMI